MKKEKRERINNIIRDRYPSCRDDYKLAAQLGISLNALRLRASKLKVKKKIINEVRNDNKKKCSKCKKYKDISEFRRDKSTSGCKHDYYCKKCRYELRQTNIAITHKIGSMAFNKGKSRNKSFTKNGIEYLRCKGCGEVKEINEGFSMDRKNPYHHHKNYCKVCLKNRREEAKIIKIKEGV